MQSLREFGRQRNIYVSLHSLESQGHRQAFAKKPGFLTIPLCLHEHCSPRSNQSSLMHCHLATASKVTNSKLCRGLAFCRAPSKLQCSLAKETYSTQATSVSRTNSAQHHYLGLTYRLAPLSLQRTVSPWSRDIMSQLGGPGARQSNAKPIPYAARPLLTDHRVVN